MHFIKYLFNYRNIKKHASSLTTKMPFIENDPLPVANKKMRMSEEFVEENQTLKTRNDKMKTLITFEKFMKERNLGKGKLTRSDLEQFCLQKISEALIHETDTGELHQTIKKQEQMIESLRKDIQQLSKQARYLDIVNKKLMTELRSQNISQKPIVPLKITRSVGLQVKLKPSNESNTRRKFLPSTAKSPRTLSTPPSIVNRQRKVQANNNVIRQVASTTSTAPSPRKTRTAAPILTQDKDKSAKKVPHKTIPNKSVGFPLKIVNKNRKNRMAKNKVSPKTTSRKGQSKTVTVGQVKTTQTGTKVCLPTRTVTTIPQGVRSTVAQMKNRVTIPASVVTVF